MVCYSHLFKNFPQFIVMHTVEGFSVVIEADIFPESIYFFYDPVDFGNLISDSSVFSKSSLNIWKFLKTGFENFKRYFTSICCCCCCC